MCHAYTEVGQKKFVDIREFVTSFFEHSLFTFNFTKTIDESSIWKYEKSFGEKSYTYLTILVKIF
jgi:hypothetical protein